MFSIPLSQTQFDQHHCSRAVISCIDFRFREADQKFILSHASEPFDHIKVAGAGKNFVSETALRDSLVAMIRNVCIQLHAIKELVVVNHWDCGAYGGSQSFQSPDQEEAAHISDLKAAYKFLTSQFPELTVRVVYSKAENGQLTYKSVE